MADNEETTEQVETTEQQPPASETPPADAQQQETSQEDEWSKDRAKATITKLRGIEKQAKQDAKKLKAYEEADDKRKKSEMDETERLKAELQDEKDQRTALELSRQRDRVRYAVEAEARKQKVITEAVPDVYALVNQDKIEFDDGGMPQGKTVEDEVKAVLETRKHMVQANGARTDNDAQAGTGGAQTGGFSEADLERISSNHGVSVQNIKKGLGIRS